MARTAAKSKSTPAQRVKGDTAADRAVYDAIRTALLDGRLPQGLKLQEPPIARALGTSRERVRGVLRRLAHEGWLRLVPNRGAFVPEIGRDEIVDNTAARIVIERAAIRQSSGAARRDARLRAHRVERAGRQRAGAPSRFRSRRTSIAC